MIITLPSGHEVLIDDSDYELIKPYKWHIISGYAQAETGNREKGTRKTIRMHRLIMGFPDSLIDHKNQNKLDNRRENLRPCNRSTNGMNRGAQVNSKSGVKGVCWEKRKGHWRVTITKNKKQKHVGSFHDIEQAKLAYQKAALELHGEFAAS